jgi:ABC-type multidrug transport system fused ATPase/permease subunit
MTQIAAKEEKNRKTSDVPAIEFSHFSFRYRSQKEPSLRDINLKIMPGEKVLIIGPSGSGKSTLAHCINGLIPCSFTGETSGTCRVEGEDPGQLGIFGMSKKGRDCPAGHGRTVHRAHRRRGSGFRSGK